MKQNKFIPIFFLCIVSCVCMGQMTMDSTALVNATVINEKDINTDHLEFCPTYYNDFILFVKSNKTHGKDDNMGDYYLDLAYAAKNDKGNLSKHAFFGLPINSEGHEGQAAFDGINDKLYFTRSIYVPGKTRYRDSIMLKIYESSKSDKFQKITPMPFSSEKYNTCHPTLNRNGDEMIFSSNMQGSKGMDLYTVKKVGATWSDPIPIHSVNSTANEVFPYLYKDSLLIFSANVEKGLGGYDFLYSTKSDTGWSVPQSIPYPINSSFDDIGFLLNNTGDLGYFSSNRPGGKGKDDIYRFEGEQTFVRKAKKPTALLCSIIVIDKLTFIPIKNANISINEFDFSKSMGNNDISKSGREGELILTIKDQSTLVTQLITDENGVSQSELNVDKSYIIKFNGAGYEEQIILYSPGNFGKEMTIVANPIKIESKEEIKNEQKPLIPTTVGSVVVFNNIYYEYGSAAIKSDAANELESLYKAMAENPSLRIQLSSHTDSRGTTIYNNQLSSQRAQSAKNYLINKGIAQDRIVAIGFGESRIRNRCIDSAKCSEEEHQFNRRTEVLIIE